MVLLFLAAGFDFGLLAFLAAGAAVELLLLVDDEAAGDDFGFDALLLDLAVPLAAFFFGDAAFFLGLLALPADFGLAADFDAAGLAFLALDDAFFLLDAAAAAVVDDDELAVAGADAFVVVVALATGAMATFFAGFFAGEGERFRLVPLAAAALGLLAALFVAAFFGDLAEADFFLAAAFFFGAAAPNVKLPLAPVPFVCFIDLFFVPARNAVLRC